jgi:hypothetical protein
MVGCGALVRRERRRESRDSTTTRCRGSSTMDPACFEEMATVDTEEGRAVAQCDGDGSSRC